ncbi:MAG: tetratricopeptide repeat protein [Gemmatimonadetes bacterium]|nr:tetratricopeptide repeat protein [Gemmatimonadota bacterium]
MRVRRWLLTVALVAAASALPGVEKATATTPAAPTDTVETLYSTAGDLYAEQRYREAIPLFRHVVELAPRHGNAYALLGGSYLQLGDYPRAIGAFERALELDEGIKLAYLGLVAANYLTERVEDARGWVNRMIPILTGEERERYLATIADQFPLLQLTAGGS